MYADGWQLAMLMQFLNPADTPNLCLDGRVSEHQGEKRELTTFGRTAGSAQST